MENKKLGMIIREHRNKLGLKVYELAKTVGVNPVYITKIEKHNDLPSIVVYTNIERALNLPHGLRVQYFKQKYPNITHGQLPVSFETMADTLNYNSPMALLDEFTCQPLKSSEDIRPFILNITNAINPNITLTEKEIKELSPLIRKIITYNRLVTKNKALFLTKIYEKNKP